MNAIPMRSKVEGTLGKFILRADFDPGRHRIWWDSCDWLEGRLTIRLGRLLTHCRAATRLRGLGPWCSRQLVGGLRRHRCPLTVSCGLTCRWSGRHVLKTHALQLGSQFIRNSSLHTPQTPGPTRRRMRTSPPRIKPIPQSLQPLPHNKDTNQCHAKNEVKLQGSIKLQTGILRFTA